MDRGIISRRYATALWMYAVRHAGEVQVYNDTLVLSHAFAELAQLRRVMTNRMLKNAKKEELIFAICGEKMSGETKRFIHLLMKNNREEFLQDICLSYQNIYRKEKKLLNVDLTLATQIDEKTQRLILKKIEDYTGQVAKLHFKHDPGIVGGYILRWDTYRLDASVIGRLQKVRKSLAAG